jgi:hypothetical protein
MTVIKTTKSEKTEKRIRFIKYLFMFFLLRSEIEGAFYRALNGSQMIVTVI